MEAPEQSPAAQGEGPPTVFLTTGLRKPGPTPHGSDSVTLLASHGGTVWLHWCDQGLQVEGSGPPLAASSKALGLQNASGDFLGLLKFLLDFRTQEWSLVHFPGCLVLVWSPDKHSPPGHFCLPAAGMAGGRSAC